MTQLEEQFSAAEAAVKQLSTRPDSETLLVLYGLYKQSTQGNVVGERPGIMDFVGRAKYDAWARHEGLSTSEAMQQYVDLVESLK